MDPYIKSSNRTFWDARQKSGAQPENLDYEKLIKNLSIPASNNSQKKDLRKKSKDDSVSYELNDDVKRLDSSSILPIPGLMVEHENGGSDRSRPSDWNNPTNNNNINGPQWNPMQY